MIAIVRWHTPQVRRVFHNIRIGPALISRPQRSHPGRPPARYPTGSRGRVACGSSHWTRTLVGPRGSTGSNQYPYSTERRALPYPRPGQTATAVSAVASKYPVQLLSRAASGFGVSCIFSPAVGIPVSGIAVYGSSFRATYQHPHAVAAAAIVGEEVCR